MSEPTKLHDDDKFPFGVHSGKRLGDIPDHYWLWFLRQEWSSKYPDLVAYGELVD